MNIYGKVSKPYWDDKPVAIVGGGSSIIDFDLDMLRGAHVLAVKRAILNIPWADAGFGLGEMPDKLNGSPGRIYWALPDDELQPPPVRNITYLRRAEGLNVSEDPGVIYSGATSGFAALQICIHKRARSIVLFGFDYDEHGSGHSGNWAKWAEHFRVYVEPLRRLGITIANASPQSTIPCFQKVTLMDGVGMLHA